MLSILNRGTIINSGLEEMVNQIAKFRRITGNALLGELEEGRRRNTINNPFPWSG